MLYYYVHAHSVDLLLLWLLMLLSCLAFNCLRYEVWLHHWRSTSIFDGPPLHSILPPMPPLTMVWCYPAKLSVAFLVLLFLAWSRSSPLSICSLMYPWHSKSVLEVLLSPTTKHTLWQHRKHLILHSKPCSFNSLIMFYNILTRSDLSWGVLQQQVYLIVQICCYC